MRKVIYLFLLISSGVYAQNPVTKNYSIEDGLPSFEIHDLVEDKNGILWIATDKGLCRFDGKTIKTYTTKDGLIDNTILSLYLSKSGRLYLSSFRGGVCYVENNKIVESPLNSKIKKVTRGQFLVSMVEDKDTTFYFTVNGVDTMYKLTKTNQLTSYHPNQVFEEHTNKNRRFIQKINNIWVFNNNVAGIKYDNNIVTIYNLIFNRERNTATFTGDDDLIMCKRSVTELDENIMLLSGYKFLAETQNGYVFIIKNGLLQDIIRFNTPVHNVYNDPETGYIFISTEKMGVSIYKNINELKLKQEHKHILAGKSISSIYKDRYSNYWFTSLKNGIYKIPSLSFLDYSEKIPPGIGIVNANSGIIFLKDDKIFHLDTNNKLTVLIPKLKYPVLLPLYYYFNKLILPSKKQIHFFDLNTQRDTLIKGIFGSTAICALSDKRVVIGSLLGFEIIENNQVLYSSQASRDLYVRISALCSINNRDFLVGTLDGLYTYINDKVEPCEPINKLNPGTITDIEKLTDSTYIIGSKNGSVLVYNLINQSIINIGEKISFPNITDIATQNDSTIWISSNKGILKIILKSTNQIVKTFIDKRDGLISNNIFQLIRTGNYLWVNTDKGTMKINITGKQKTLPLPTIVIDDIKFNDKSYIDYIQNSSTTFKWNENNLEIYYLSNSNSSEGSLTFAYILEGYDLDTNYTSNENIRFTNIPSGNYTIHIWSIDKNNNWSTPALFSFIILPHYTETWWFISLIVLAGLLIISSIFLLIIRNLKRRNEIQKELLLLEQKALRAQMNPHFTFNALNSIQYFITDNNKRAATTFLSKFSKLVRNILNNSKTNTISLADEIITLTTYLELEQMRFNGKIEVEIIVDDELMPDDIFIPSMIIQPFVENAIWHGIMPKEDNTGKLELSFELKASTLICTVKDNGIGRKKSAELKEQTRKGHQSAGLKNIEDRIAVLNHINKTQIRLEITDLFDNETAAGTMATIYFQLEVE